MSAGALRKPAAKSGILLPTHALDMQSDTCVTSKVPNPASQAPQNLQNSGFFSTPDRITFDMSISPWAFRLVVVLGSLTWRSGAVKISFGDIAALLGVSARTAKRLVDELRHGGWITTKRTANEKNVYRMTKKALVNSPAQDPKTAAPGICECGRAIAKSSSGACHACAREAVMKADYAAARAALPDGSTHQQISAQVVVNKAAKRYSRTAKDVDRDVQKDLEWSHAG